MTYYADEDQNDYEDFEAQMRMEREDFATDEEWDEFILEQEAGAWCDEERKAERALSFGYGS